MWIWPDAALPLTPDPLNAGEKLSSYIDQLLATYQSARGCLTPSELNIRDVAEQGVAKVDVKSEI